jgi:predicted ATPase
VPTIAQALDVPVEHEDDPLAAISDTLAARELLLVVDNAEHLRAAAPCYSQLVARVPRLVILVTSRSVLHISGEHVFPVVPLSEDDAMELFAQRARLLRADFELTSANSEDVREICRRLDCLPLAVELASARIGILTPDALRRRLNTRLGVLATGPRDLPARQQTLRETIAWSVGLLDDSAREVFVRLSVFPAGATIAAAENVCAADLDVLAALVDDNLVRRDDVDGEPRFGMLETVREFALEQLGDELRVTRLKMATHLAALAESVEVEARANAQALARLDPEIDNVRAALDECAEAGDAQLELRLAGGIWRYWWFRGAPAEGIRSIERALSVDGGVPTPFRAQALRGAAGLAWALGDLERAKELAHATIPVAVEAGSAWDEMAANTVLGLVANAEGDRALARGHHRRSIELAEEVGHEPSAQKLNLGAVALDEGDFGEARVMLEDVLAIHRRNENLEGIGTALLNLGLVHHALGEHRASFEAFQEARSCFEEVGFRAHVAHALQGVAAFEASEGRFAEAVLLLGRARRELDEIGAPEGDVVGEAVSWTKQLALDALGQEEYGRLYSSAHEGKE